MEIITESLAGIGSFALYFALSLLLLIVFKFLYTMVTPHDEWKLVKEDKCVAAATALAGAVIGFSIALAGAATNSVSILDYVIWGAVALVAQILAFLMVRVIMPRISERIQQDEIAAGIVLAGASIAVGLLNAACMSW